MFHVIETPGAIDELAEKGPMDAYYAALKEDLAKDTPIRPVLGRPYRRIRIIFRS